MRARVQAFASRCLPRGWVDLLRQILLFCGAYRLYRLGAVTAVVSACCALAFAQARPAAWAWNPATAKSA